jgi:hypothetical protein
LKELKMVPSTWPCDHYSCPNGFFVYEGDLYMRADKFTDHNGEGEEVEFQGPEPVYPCKPVWIEIED